MRHSCLQHETRPYSITARCNRIKPPLISKHGRCTKCLWGRVARNFHGEFSMEGGCSRSRTKPDQRSQSFFHLLLSSFYFPSLATRLFPFPTHRLLPHFRAVPAGKRHRQPPQVCPAGFSPANESRQSPLGGARVFRLCVLVVFKKMVVDSGGWVPWFFLGWWLVVGTMMSSPWLESRVITRIRFLAMGGASVYIEFGPGSLRMTQVLQISRGVFVFKYCGRVLFDQCGQISFFLSLGFEGQ